MPVLNIASFDPERNHCATTSNDPFNLLLAFPYPNALPLICHIYLVVRFMFQFMLIYKPLLEVGKIYSFSEFRISRK
ncbi:hypothetical protein NX02_14885 [Sphingomonas sanxanigenens DSM 19645 = NX02]|uniref:Uncharacterized protein n=1 Tax=Sphingomonas sanxanigenens DSM 19645 = NX02 TaxID=1123269 RepID=W0AC56_9SPHN|nr:hypothetical protein NX02_14885 [Sphingomonas sanxanigenens DSM 19645 = NX02]